ncbi:MAG TPA: DUF2232 domain-containing protein [Pseudolabrys sp.]|nr:DUF2232 domain-containing protein [Pseudolabrys sp.]
MMQIGLIGVGAGAVAALLFASVTSGSLLSIALFYLAPLPVMISGLGWSHWSALIAAITGATALGLAFGGYFFFAFLAGVGLPAWWLGHLTMLARPAGGANGAAPELEWYPPGRLVLWAAILGALTVMVAIPNLGFDADTIRSNLHHALNQLLRIEGSGASQGALKGGAETKRFIDFLVEAIPPAAAVLSALTNMINLWLGARVVAFSGRLKRPWPDLSTMTFPHSLAGVLAAAVVLSFAPGLGGLIAGVVTAALLMAFGVLGFAVMHAVTRPMNARGLVLGSVYAAVLVFGWPLLVMCLIGLADMFIGLRARAAARRGGPPGSV